MKKYIVTIKFKGINRKNELTVWAENEEEAKRFALKSWGSTIYESLTAKVVGNEAEPENKYNIEARATREGIRTI